MNQFIFAVALRSIEVEIGNWIETFNFFIHLENIQIDETYIWKTLKLLHIWWFGEQEVSHWCCRTGLCSEFMWTIVIMIGFLGKRSYASTINHGHLASTPLLHLCWGRNVYKQTQTEMINFLAAKIVLGARYKTTQVFAALRWQYQWEIRFQQIAWQQLMNMMILTADPQEILTPFQDWKNWPSDTCVGAHYAHSQFWPQLAKKWFSFNNFSYNGKLLKLAGIDQHHWGRIWIKNSSQLPSIPPQKTWLYDLEGLKMGEQNLTPILPTGGLNLLAIYEES